MSKITTTLVNGQQYTQEYAAEVKSSVNALYDQIGSYKSYVAKLSQAGGGSDPLTSVVLANTLGAVTLSHPSTGTFQIAASGITDVKTFVSITGNLFEDPSVYSFIVNAGNVQVFRKSFSGGNFVAQDGLGGLSIEIRVYE